MSDGSPVSRPRTAYRDERGTIIDLVEGEHFDSATVITTVGGAIRGNHYHLQTTQVLYVVRGRVELLSQFPEGPVRSFIASAGDLVRTVPGERHAIVALEDTEMVVLTRGPRSGQRYESDTFRLTEPLRRSASSGEDVT